jgi:hypothetical protein
MRSRSLCLPDLTGCGVDVFREGIQTHVPKADAPCHMEVLHRVITPTAPSVPLEAHITCTFHLKKVQRKEWLQKRKRGRARSDPKALESRQHMYNAPLFKVDAQVFLLCSSCAMLNSFPYTSTLGNVTTGGLQ